MPVQNKPIIHARDHEPGGADPIEFPATVPGDYEQMALAWSDAYWKLEETELGSYFLDELPGHHDLETTTESGLSRGVSHGPAEPASVGIWLNGGTMAPGSPGSPGPYLYPHSTDPDLGVADNNRIAFFAVVTVDAPPDPTDETASVAQKYCLAGCWLPGEVTPDVGMRWALEFMPQLDGLGEFSGHLVRGQVYGPGGLGSVDGFSLIGPALGGFPYGVPFDVGFNYTGSQIQVYLNGLLEAEGSAPAAWTNTDREGIFQLGAMNRTAGGTGSWENFQGTIGSAMLSVDGAFSSGQFHDLSEGTPSSSIVEDLPAGAIVPDKIEPGTDGYVLKTTGGVTSWERQTVQVNY